MISRMEKLTMDETFKSGKEYSLNYIFSGKKKIVIPDLQRDYCWGDKAWDKDKKEHTELVSDFVEKLIEVFLNKKDDKITLGLFYGYEYPTYHIQLCDGQQRITTLFLLLGMLNRRTANNGFQKYLISDYELDDDKEPYLQYAIRESTLYFLSDLVCNFFLEKNISVNEIKEQKWYFTEYNLDASIQSMIKALRKIDDIISKKNPLDYNEFGSFILERLKIFYYDMGKRTQGEKTFVIINTTGEPLTATENLKPILIGNITDEKKRKLYSDAWEDREEWFWQNRSTNPTADNGVNEFFRWVNLLESNIDEWKKHIETNKDSDFLINRQNKQPSLKTEEEICKYLEKLNGYFKIVKFLFDNYFIKKVEKKYVAPDIENKQITLFILLPIIKYVKHFETNTSKRSIIRVKQFFENLAKVEDISKRIGNLLPESIFIIEKLIETNNDDIASVYTRNDISEHLLTPEEKRKFELYLTHENREELEDKFWKAEGHKIWSGEIAPLIKWSTDINNCFDVNKFDSYERVFSALFYDKCDYAELDLTRRALLTRNLKAYPRIFRRYINYNFCWEPADWRILVRDNEDEFKKFLDVLIEEESVNVSYKDTELKMIGEYKGGKDTDDFVNYEKFLEYCEEKNVRRDGEDWILMKNQKGVRTSLKSYLLFLELEKIKPDSFSSNWKLESDFYSERYKYVISSFIFKEKFHINVFYVKNNFYQLQLFKCDSSIDADIINIAEIENLKQKDRKYESEEMDKDRILALLEKLMNTINKLS